MMDDTDELDNAELLTAFDKLFPKGFAGADVLHELVPEGWESSPLFALFHPSPQKQFEEAVTIHRNLSSLRKPDDTRPPSPEPKFEEFAEDGESGPVDIEGDVSRLVGLALWDVFSDNHDVKDSDGRRLHLGSHRGSGGFLADYCNRQIERGLLKGPSAEELQRVAELDQQLLKMMGPGAELMMKMLKEEQTGPFRYTDFYMGTGMIAGRADLGPVYRMIFQRLKAQGYDWKYSFPRIFAINMRPLKEAMDQKDKPEWEGYDPEASFAKEEEDAEHDREHSELSESLDEAYRESVEAAQDQPPPATVLAYEAVYGDYPEGWPPVAE